MKKLKIFLQIRFEFIRTTDVTNVQTTFGIDEITILEETSNLIKKIQV